MLNSTVEAPTNPSKRPQFSSSRCFCWSEQSGTETILLAVMGHILFPFIWWKASLSKEASKILLIKDPLKRKQRRVGVGRGMGVTNQKDGGNSEGVCRLL